MIDPQNVKTQKARGIVYGQAFDRIGHYGWESGLRFSTLPITMIVSAADPNAVHELTVLVENQRGMHYSDGHFFRPCPMRPRHGFVDSRVCRTEDDVRALVAETLAADPEGEIVVQPLVDAQWSAIVTSTAVSVGPGNDGATAGNKSTVYPLALPQLSDIERNDLDISDGEDVYAEFVRSRDGRSHLVQLRGGLMQENPCIKAYVPRTITVGQVLDAGGDGLEWERLMLLHQESSTVVAWHPGGTTLSHYAIHALFNKVAILFGGERPKVGDVIEPVDIAAMMEPYDTRRVRLGAIKALASAPQVLTTPDGMADGLAFAAAGLHSAMTLRTEAAAEMLGGAAATLMLLASAACCGELRHKKGARRSHNLSSSRHQVFHDVFRDYYNSRAVLRAAVRSFASARWGAGYGGRAWALCAAMAIDLEGALLDLVSGAENVERVIKLSHRLLNAVHNGGALLNKFGSETILNRAASGSRRVVAHAAMYWHANLYNAVPVDQLVDGAITLMQQKPIKSPVMALWNSEAGEFRLPESAGSAGDKVLVQARMLSADEVKFQIAITQGVDYSKVATAAKRIRNVVSIGAGGPTKRVTMTTRDPNVVDAVKRDWYMHARPLKYSHAAGSKILYIPAASATKSGNDVDVVYSESTIRLSLDNYTATFIVQ